MDNNLCAIFSTPFEVNELEMSEINPWLYANLENSLVVNLSTADLKFLDEIGLFIYVNSISENMIHVGGDGNIFGESVLKNTIRFLESRLKNGSSCKEGTDRILLKLIKASTWSLKNDRTLFFKLW